MHHDELDGIRVSEVRIRLPKTEGRPEFLAYCSFTLNGWFAVRNAKILRIGPKWHLAMPSAPLADFCACGGRNRLQAWFCNYCGGPLKKGRRMPGNSKDRKNYLDVCFPATRPARLFLERQVFEAYFEAVSASGASPPGEPIAEWLDEDDEAIREILPFERSA